MIKIARLLLVTFCCCSSVTAAPSVGQPTSYWYMGTASGSDCNLIMRPDHTLTVQYSGCFSRGPLIQASWQQQADKITFVNLTLNERLGNAFIPHQYKGYSILVPASEASYVAKHGYNRAHCFWTNLRPGSLEWPSAVKDFDKDRPIT